LTKRSRWSGASLLDRPKPRWKSWLYFFLIGFYGGVVQMGIGVLMLIVLVLIDKWSMRDGNVIKIIMANVLSVPAAFIYFSSDLMAWRPGLILAAGGMIGSWIGARYLVRMPRIQPYVRYLLIAVVAFGSVQAIIKALT
ncbi:MAG: sulfite exporter TauE/SafE family protein, partial [Schleiferiaceae bacterium]|nr:sulfite exporter TauE/SafE family protein [Schleiferiaceae bacterium]